MAKLSTSQGWMGLDHTKKRVPVATGTRFFNSDQYLVRSFEGGVRVLPQEIEGGSLLRG